MVGLALIGISSCCVGQTDGWVEPILNVTRRPQHGTTCTAWSVICWCATKPTEPGQHYLSHSNQANKCSYFFITPVFKAENFITPINLRKQEWSNALLLTISISSISWASLTQQQIMTDIRVVDWLIEQGLTSPPTQYRLYGRRFFYIRVKRQHILHSTTRNSRLQSGITVEYM